MTGVDASPLRSEVERAEIPDESIKDIEELHATFELDSTFSPRPCLCGWSVFTPSPARTQTRLGQPGCGEPEIKTFGKQLLTSFKATFTSKQNLLPLAVGGGATAMTSIWDEDVQGSFADPNRSTVAGDIGAWLGGPIVLAGAAGGALAAVENAFVLAAVRRLARQPDAPPPGIIRSLA